MARSMQTRTLKQSRSLGLSLKNERAVPRRQQAVVDLIGMTGPVTKDVEEEEKTRSWRGLT